MRVISFIVLLGLYQTVFAKHHFQVGRNAKPAQWSFRSA